MGTTLFMARKTIVSRSPVSPENNERAPTPGFYKRPAYIMRLRKRPYRILYELLGGKGAGFVPSLIAIYRIGGLSENK